MARQKNNSDGTTPTMKLQIASDLHLEYHPGNLPPPHMFTPVPDRDLLILAGDVGIHRLARPFIKRELQHSPVVYVPGNHEYHTSLERHYVDADWFAFSGLYPHFHYLVAQAATINGLRLWGAPWYSNFWSIDSIIKINHLCKGIQDFKPRHNAAQWTPAAHRAEHLAQTKELEHYAGTLDLVVTHWPPTPGAIHPVYKHDLHNPYFYNDHAALVRRINAPLWISGHTHESFDYRVGNTRIVGNPAGYPGEEHASTTFLPDFCIDLDAPDPRT